MHLRILESKNHQNTLFLSEETSWMSWSAWYKKSGRGNMECILFNDVLESALFWNLHFFSRICTFFENLHFFNGILMIFSTRILQPSINLRMSHRDSLQVLPSAEIPAGTKFWVSPPVWNWRGAKLDFFRNLHFFENLHFFRKSALFSKSALF